MPDNAIEEAQACLLKAVEAVSTAYPPLDPPSSQPTETEPLDLLDEFFEWCFRRMNWKGCKADIGKSQSSLQEKGFDFDAAAVITAEQWKDLSLKSSQLDKFKTTCPKFKAERRSQRKK